jgi:hypothetical protein
MSTFWANWRAQFASLVLLLPTVAALNAQIPLEAPTKVPPIATPAHPLLETDIWTPDEECAKKEIEKLGGKVFLYYRDSISPYYPELTSSDFLKSYKTLTDAAHKYDGRVNDIKIADIQKSLDKDDASNFPSTSTNADKLKYLLKFKVVVFLNSNLSDTDLSTVTWALCKIQNLIKLDLSYTKVKGTGLWGLKCLGSLRDLDLSSTPLSKIGLCQLIQLLQPSTSGSSSIGQTLQHLRLNGTLLPADELSKLLREGVSNAKGISLYLANIAIASDTSEIDICFALPEGCMDRASLSLVASKAPNVIGIDTWLIKFKDDLQNVYKLPSVNGLAGIDLSNTGLGDDGFAALLGIINKSTFKALVVNGDKITDKGLKSFRDVNDNQLFSNISKLDVGGNTKITNVGLNCLSGVTALADLSLAGLSLVTDKGVLTVIKGTKLIKLNVSATSILGKDSDPANDLKWIGPLSNIETLNLSKTGIGGVTGIQNVPGSGGDSGELYHILANGNLNMLTTLDISGTRITDRILINALAVGTIKLSSLYYGDTKITTGGLNLLNSLVLENKVRFRTFFNHAIIPLAPPTTERQPIRGISGSLNRQQ